MKKLLATLAVFAALATANAGHQMRVTFTGYAGRTDVLQNFPALVEIAEPGKLFFDPTGATDLRFYDEEANLLAHEIDTVDPGVKTLAWVKIPELHPHGGTSIIAVWGDDPAGLEAARPVSDVWSDGYAIVQHYNETPGTKPVFDSSGNNNHGQIHQPSATPAVGVIGRAVNLSQGNGHNNGMYMDNPAGFAINDTGAWTISAWFYGLRDNTDWRTLTREPMVATDPGHVDTHHIIIQTGSDKLGMHLSGGAGGFIQADSAELAPGPGWRHIAAVGAAGQTKYYVDGFLLGTATRQPARNILAIGFYQDNTMPPTTPSQQFAEQLDEFRVAQAARSVDWLWAEIQNQRTPASFASLTPADANGILRVTGMPPGVGEVDPPFGWIGNLANGDPVPASAVPVWTNAATMTTLAVVTGWQVFTNSPLDVFELMEESMGTGSNAVAYTHQGVEGKLVWHFAVSNLIEATSGPGGHVDNAGWHDETFLVELEAVADPGYEFYRWTGNVPAGGAYSNPLAFLGDVPRVLRAEFTAKGAGDVRYVATDGLETNGGTSFADAKLTIAAAIASLPNNTGVVIVAIGQYPVTSQIEINNAVEVRGATGDPADVTVFRPGSSPNQNRVFKLTHADARVSFLTIADGYCNANEGGNMTGGNVYIGAGTVADCVLRN
ncbi:MAG: hypothetical protein FWF96_08355, partial [Kiritimatiellaeota bacterium]|nr:hypothetical protein [Kiritimatiellota bacterium]